MTLKFNLNLLNHKRMQINNPCLKEIIVASIYMLLGTKHRDARVNISMQMKLNVHGKLSSY